MRLLMMLQDRLEFLWLVVPLAFALGLACLATVLCQRTFTKTPVTREYDENRTAFPSFARILRSSRGFRLGYATFKLVCFVAGVLEMIFTSEVGYAASMLGLVVGLHIGGWFER